MDGSLFRTTPKEGDEFSEMYTWDMANSMLCFWLLNVIDLKFCTTIAYSDIAKFMWDNVKKRYAVANSSKIQQLKANFANCK